MNREDRRKRKKKGAPMPKSEPTYQVKPSQLGKMVTEGIGKEAMKREIRRQILDMDRDYQLDLDTMVLWALRQYAGWGPKKLKEFYLFMGEEHERMRKYYELDDFYPERYRLKELGVDLVALNKEYFGEEISPDARSTAIEEKKEKNK